MSPIFSSKNCIKANFDASTKQAFGNYRIINDIDLSDLSLGGSDTTTLLSTEYTFMRKIDEFGAVIGYGILEGNSMTISNLDFSTLQAVKIKRRFTKIKRRFATLKRRFSTDKTPFCEMHSLF